MGRLAQIDPDGTLRIIDAFGAASGTPAIDYLWATFSGSLATAASSTATLLPCDDMTFGGGFSGYTSNSGVFVVEDTGAGFGITIKEYGMYVIHGQATFHFTGSPVAGTCANISIGFSDRLVGGTIYASFVQVPGSGLCESDPSFIYMINMDPDWVSLPLGPYNVFGIQNSGSTVDYAGDLMVWRLNDRTDPDNA